MIHKIIIQTIFLKFQIQLILSLVHACWNDAHDLKNITYSQYITSTAINFSSYTIFLEWGLHLRGEFLAELLLAQVDEPGVGAGGGGGSGLLLGGGCRAAADAARKKTQ